MKKPLALRVTEGAISAIVLECSTTWSHISQYRWEDEDPETMKSRHLAYCLLLSAPIIFPASGVWSPAFTMLIFR
jgi:hypothetical protein